MNLLSDIITYVRRIIKSPSNTDISDALIIDYINRFWIMDVDADLQLFDLKTKYAFQTTPGVDQYNMPLYDVQRGSTNDGSVSLNIGMYPVYQGFVGPAYVNGVQIAFETQKNIFFNAFPNIVQNPMIVGVGNGSSGPYTLQIPQLGSFNNVPNPPLQGILRGHVDMAGIIATGLNIDPPLVQTIDLNIPTTSINSAVYFTSINTQGANVILQDSGQFLSSDVNLGLLMNPGNAPYGNTAASNGYLVNFTITGITQAAQAVVTAATSFQAGQTVQIIGVGGMTEINNQTFTVVSATPTTVTLDVDSTAFTAYTSGGTISSIQNVIDYFTGEATNVYFSSAIPEGNNIFAQCRFFQNGLPRMMLYYNNVITLRVPPAYQYLVELDAYLTPAAFFNTSAAVPFAYMSEYIARGAARKIMSDTGDEDQMAFYEPLFQEQKSFVHIRSQRQWTATRTQTIYSQSNGQGRGWAGYNGSGFY